jgi:transposase
VFFRAVLPHLDERQRRLLAGSVARLVGRGGIAAVAETASMSRSTVQRAVSEIDAGIEVTARVRGPGAGRPKTVDAQPGLLLALDELVEPESRGDPMCPLRWTTKSTRTLAGELARQGYSVSHVTVGELLHEMGYSLQANAKENEGSQHADRDAQFVHLNTEVVQHLSTGQPVISVDAKKKEVVGDLKNAGKTWEPTGKPQRVATHDFPDKEVPKAVPYGVYDLGSNEGFVSVGDSGDTAAFAVETIRRWWDLVGSHAYPDAKRLLVTADAGGSNGYRIRLWKLELAKLARETGIEITVCHFPPGTSKWNNRASALEPRLDELEGPSTRQPSSRCRPHRRHHDAYGPQGQGRPRPELLPPRDQDHRQTTERSAAPAPRLPRRVELHGAAALNYSRVVHSAM